MRVVYVTLDVALEVPDGQTAKATALELSNMLWKGLRRGADPDADFDIRAKERAAFKMAEVDPAHPLDFRVDEADPASVDCWYAVNRRCR